MLGQLNINCVFGVLVYYFVKVVGSVSYKFMFFSRYILKSRFGEYDLIILQKILADLIFRRQFVLRLYSRYENKFEIDKNNLF